MKKYTLVILMVVLVGCGKSNIDRPVLQPISVEEITKLEKDYPGFSACYEKVTYVRNEKSDEGLQNYSNLTYKKVYDFLVTISTQQDNIKAEIQNEWQQYYGFYESKLDSLHDNLTEWFEANKLESRVRITCVDVLPTPEDANAWQVSSFYCKVKVENLTNELIEDVKYELAICDTKKNAYSVLVSANTAAKADGSLYTAWSTQYGKTWTKDKKSLLDYSQEDLYEHYNIDYRIISLRQNGKLLTNNNIQEANPNFDILSKQLWKTNMMPTGRLYYLRQAVKSLFNVDYLTPEEYHNKVIDNKLQSIDPESFKFLSTCEK